MFLELVQPEEVPQETMLDSEGQPVATDTLSHVYLDQVCVCPT